MSIPDLEGAKEDIVKIELRWHMGRIEEAFSRSLRRDGG
jgi:hypothetical protein